MSEPLLRRLDVDRRERWVELIRCDNCGEGGVTWKINTYVPQNICHDCAQNLAPDYRMRDL